MKRMTSGLLALILLPSQALAADWTGAYVGVTTGLNSADYVYSEIGVPWDFEWGDASAYGGGIFAGYNFQNGNVVVGGEIAYSTGVHLSRTGPPEVTGVLSARARVGYAFGRALIYGGAGLVHLETTEGLAGTTLHFGHTLGVGIDYKFSDRMFLGLDYQHMEVKGRLPPPYDVFISTLDGDQVNLRLGVTF